MARRECTNVGIEVDNPIRSELLEAELCQSIGVVLKKTCTMDQS